MKPEVGDVTILEFSGYETYYDHYSAFLGDASSLHIVVIKMKDTLDVRKDQLFFWFNFIRAKMIPREPIGTFLKYSLE